MKTISFIKSLTLICLLAAMSVSTASAAAINLNAGEFKFTGDSYIDTTLASETRAVGRITTISQAGNIIWSSGANDYINFLAEGILPVVSPVAPTFNFVATSGTVNLYRTSVDLLDLSLNYASLSGLINTTELYLSTAVSGDIVGIATGVSYSANGFLDVTGGTAASIYDTNSRSTFVNGVLADLSFGLSGSNNNNALVNTDYQYITSSDIQGSVSTVPLPGTLMLFSAGLGALGLVTGKRKTTIVH